MEEKLDMDKNWSVKLTQNLDLEAKSRRVKNNCKIKRVGYITFFMDYYSMNG